MRKFTFSFKSLLAAALLCVGQNAWAVDEVYNFRNFISGLGGVNPTLVKGSSVTVGENTMYLVADFTETNYPDLRDDAVHQAKAFNTNGRFAVGNETWQLRRKADAGYMIRPSSAAGTLSILDLNEGDKITFDFTTDESSDNNTNDNKITITSTNIKVSGGAAVAAGTSIVDGTTYEMTADGHMDLAVARYVGFRSITITPNPDVEVVTGPTIAAVAANGVNRTVEISGGSTSKGDASITSYRYTLDGTTPTASVGTLYDSSNKPVISTTTTIKAVAISSTGKASNATSTSIPAGTTLTLNAPTLTITDFAKSGEIYYPQYTFSSNQTSVIGNPSVTYSYTIAGVPNATPNPSGYSEAKAGELIVTVSAEGYNSASTAANVLPYILSTNYDFTNSAILTAAWTDASGTEKWVNSGDAEAYKENSVTTSSSTALFDGFTVTDAGSRLNKMHWHSGKGVQFVNSGGNFTIGLTSVPANAIIRNTYYQNGSNRYAIGNTITIGRYNQTGEKQGLVAIDVFTPDPVALAIADCKKYETSSEFATAVAAESFSTAAEVYTFHTNWQIAKAKASGSTDITKVIRNAAITSTTDWVGSRVIELGDQVYDGAPDNFLIDANNQEMDTYQMIYGLPAGKYTVKAATRANAEVTSGKIYVYAEGQVDKNADGHHVGNTGGDLDNGWSWTSIDFELTSTSDVKIGYYVNATGSGKWASCDDWHLNIASVPVTVTDAGYATYVSEYNLDYTDTDIKAYTAAVNVSTGVITLTRINKVPANTPVLLYKDGGATENIPVTATVDAVGTNNLVAGTGAAVATYDGDGKYNYILNKKVSGVGFYKAAGNTVAANRAYLQTGFNVSTSPVKALTIVFDDETATSVDAPVAAETAEEDGVLYNTSGQQVTEDYKGIVIKNGKKYIQK